MNAKILIFVICVKAIIYICYYVICMTVPLGFSTLLAFSNFHLLQNISGAPKTP